MDGQKNSPSNPDISRFLEQAGDDGQHDSGGVFTLNIESAKEKMARSQLPRESSWVLKTVQSAVTDGAPSVSIKQFRARTEFRFQATSLDLNSLENLFYRVDLKAKGPAGHLAKGLQAAGIGQERKFELALTANGITQKLSWDGVELSKSSSPTSSSGGEVKLCVSTPGLNRKRIVIEEYQELCLGCVCSPIPILCDKRRLDTLRPKNPTKLDMAYVSCIWRKPENDAVPSLRVPNGVGLKPKWTWPGDRFTNSQVFLLDGDAAQEESSFLATLSFHYRISSSVENKGGKFEYKTAPSTSNICWVKDGIVCDTEALKLSDLSPVRMCLYLSAENLPTDASGLRLLDSFEKNHRTIFGLKQITSSFQPTIEALENHEVNAWDLSLLPMGGFLSAHGIIMAVGFKGATLPIHLSFLYLLYKCRVDYKKFVVMECVRYIRELKRWIQHLAKEMANSEETASGE